MKIIVNIGVQFMLKDREMDIPSMLPRMTHKYPMNVEVSPELTPFIEEYSKSVEDATYTPSYDISGVLLKIITPRVKKAYPEHWRKEKTDDGKVIQFKPTPETILETAIRMEVEDKIDELLDEHKDEVLKDLEIKFPEDTGDHYLANTFVTNLGWKLS